MITFNWPNAAGPIGQEEVLSAPTVASKGKGQLDVFVIGPDNQVWGKWWSYEGGYKWSDWGVVGGRVWHNSAPAVASKNPGQLDMFVTGDDKTVYFRYYNQQNGWNAAWVPVGEGFVGSPGLSCISPGVDMLVVPDEDSKVAFLPVSPAIPNPIWTHLADGFDVVDAPTCVSDLLFARNPIDNHVYVKTMVGNPWIANQESPWVSIGGNLMSAPAVLDYGGMLIVFGQSPDDKTLWYNARDNGSPEWQDWIQIGDVMTSAPAAVSKDENQIDLFFRGPDGRLWGKSGFIN